MGDETIQESLREAFAEHESTDSTSTPQPRDDQGRFATRPEPSEVQAAATLQPDAPKLPAGQQEPPAAAPAAQQPAGTTPPAQPDGQWTQDKAPQSWTPEAREQWMTIPEPLRKEIIRREEASIAGVRQMQEQWAPVQQVIQGIDPYVREAVSHGIDPTVYLGAVLQSERLLRMADLPTKFNEYIRIGEQYGIPIREIIDASVGQQVMTGQAKQQQQQQLPSWAMQELQEMREWRAQTENQSIEREVAAFSQDKEFFQDVRNQMASLVEHGIANSLQDAYDQACWANPSVRAVLQQRAAAGTAQNDLQQRQQRATAASLAPNGKIDVKLPASGGDDESLEDTVRAEILRATTNRV